jgi:hypothetical protein
MTVELQDVLNLALQLSPRERIRLIERIASSVEETLPEQQAVTSDHWGQSLNRLLGELGPIEMKNPEIEDPVEWVNEQRRQDNG